MIFIMLVGRHSPGVTTSESWRKKSSFLKFWELVRSRVKGRVGRVADIINALNLCVSQGSSVVGGREKG